MSRARPITVNGQTVWFDTDKNHRKATDKQLELLASCEDVDLEDLLESGITQGEVIRRLREAIGENAIPYEVLARRQKFRRARAEQPPCRLCRKVGDSTRHHFVNKWILKELESYERLWSNRRENCIPVCIDCHRDLHDRANDAISIVEYLNDEERAFAARAIAAFAEQRPHVFILVAKGTAYESQLLRDWLAGHFDEVRPAEASTPLTVAA